jgi:hypothetical protein
MYWRESTDMDDDIEGSEPEEQKFPSELGGSLPRKVQLNSTNASPLLVVALLCMGLGGIAFGYDCYDDLKEIRQRTVLRQEGRDTVGKVSARHAGHGRATVSYIFKVNEGYYSGRAEMPDYRLLLHESDPIAVRYLQTDPGVNHPADWEWSGLEIMDLIPQAFVLFLTMVGIVPLVALFRDRKLAREGKRTKGMVIDCSPGKTEFRVEYEFRTDDGVPMTGRTSVSDEYGSGARVWVLYLPQKPQRNSMYPLRYFEVADD